MFYSNLDVRKIELRLWLIILVICRE